MKRCPIVISVNRHKHNVPLEDSAGQNMSRELKQCFCFDFKGHFIVVCYLLFYFQPVKTHSDANREVCRSGFSLQKPYVAYGASVFSYVRFRKCELDRKVSVMAAFVFFIAYIINSKRKVHCNNVNCNLNIYIFPIFVL